MARNNYYSNVYDEDILIVQWSFLIVMKRSSKPNRNADPEQFMAPHNSIIEGFNIPRYAHHPYHSKPSNSAPATIHPTPNVSREVSKGSVECQQLLLHRKSSFQRRRIRALLEEPGEETVRVAKSGYAVQNYLQGRLYDAPADSEVYRNIRVNLLNWHIFTSSSNFVKWLTQQNTISVLHYPNLWFAFG